MAGVLTEDEVRARLTRADLHAWLAYWALEADEQERAMKKARAEAATKGR